MSDIVPVERIEEVAGLYFRSVLIPSAGMRMQQHIHDHDHATFVGSGKVRAWSDGWLLGDFSAAMAVEIKAGATHVFEALEDNTRVTCVHNIASAESVKAKGY